MARLLVVDDSATVRKAVEVAYRGSSWILDFATTGMEGVARAKSSPPDAILLDFVLPDMRGVEVCERLAADVRTKRVPIVVMSAKGDAIRSLFEPAWGIAAYIGKPFAVPELRQRVADAVRARTGDQGPDEHATASSAAATSFSKTQLEVAAKAIYARLKTGLSALPRVLAQLGDQPSGAVIARRLLTPELVEDILGALLPVARGSAAPSDDPARAAPAPESTAHFEGDVRGWPLSDLFTPLFASARTGEFRFRSSEGAYISAYLKDGEVIMLTCRDATAYGRGGLDVSRVAPALLAQATAEQKATGKPSYVTLAEHGALPACDLTELLHRQGKRLLAELTEARDGHFAWVDLPALPQYVEAHRRHVSLLRDTLVFGLRSGSSGPASSLKQLALEHLRAAPQDPEAAPALDEVYDRARGFSAKVRDYDLNADERRVLTAIAGRLTIAAVGERAAVDPARIAHIVRRLREVGLIEPTQAEQSEAVMILEPDVEGFLRPLESLLQNRRAPMMLHDLATERSVIDAVRRERPRLVMLNASSDPDIERTLRSIRETEGLGNVSVVAIVEAPLASRADALTAAGFDAVLVKPVAYADLERLIDR